MKEKFALPNWSEVATLLRRAGVSNASEAIRHAKANGLQATDVKDIIEHYTTHRTGDPPGVLYQRIIQGSPGRMVTAGWPTERIESATERFTREEKFRLKEQAEFSAQCDASRKRKANELSEIRRLREIVGDEYDQLTGSERFAMAGIGQPGILSRIYPTHELKILKTLAGE